MNHQYSYVYDRTNLGQLGLFLRFLRFYKPLIINQSLIKSSFTFLSKNSIDQNIPNKLGLQKKCIAVENTRNINKSHLKLNSKLPNISVNPQTYEVFSDGEILTCEPLDEVPMAQRYFLL